MKFKNVLLWVLLHFFLRITLATENRCLLPRIDRCVSLELEGSGCDSPLGFTEIITEIRTPQRTLLEVTCKLWFSSITINIAKLLLPNIPVLFSRFSFCVLIKIPNIEFFCRYKEVFFTIIFFISHRQAMGLTYKQQKVKFI